MSKRPNTLFLNTDQHLWNALSVHGNPYLHTPNIDRLYHNGTSLSQSYCSDPVCAAARSTWATGLYTSETGVPFNGGHLRTDISDLGQVLNANGYKAFPCGKWHVPGRNVRESFRTLYYGHRDIGAGGAAYYDSASTHAVANFLTDSYKELFRKMHCRPFLKTSTMTNRRRCYTAFVTGVMTRSSMQLSLKRCAVGTNSSDDT